MSGGDERPRERWGVGANAGDPAFDQVEIEGQTADLIHGEFPHIRDNRSIYARFPSNPGEKPYVVGFDGHRVKQRIEVSTRNYLKTSHLSGDQVRKACELRILLNDYLCHVEGFREPTRALLQAVAVLPKLMEHPVRLWDRNERTKLLGRKVWYRDQPAVVDTLTQDACVILRADTPDGYFTPTSWEQDAAEDRVHQPDPRAKIEFLSDWIFWFRK